MRRRWPASLDRVLWVLVAATIVGLLIEHLLAVLVIGILVCLVGYGVHLYRLEQWIWEGMQTPPPVEDDVWIEAYRRMSRLRNRGRKRKRKLSRIIKQFREASSALPDAVVVLGDDDEVLWLNAAAQCFLGLKSPQDIGLRITHLVRHPSLVEFLARQQYQGSVDLPSPVDPELLLNVHVRPYGKKRRLLLARDITQVRRLEHMRRDFVANVSHELKTPLTVINGYVETFLDSDDGGNSPWRLPLQSMHQQAGRMLHIIEDLLILSRLETDTARRAARPVAVPTLLASIVEDAVVLSGERKHAFRTAVDPELWIRGCEQELRSAFSNLVFNAVRYTGAGGHVDIRWFVDDGGLHFQVEDDGEGIPAQHIPRLTERFYRVDRGRQRRSGGTGLGLAITKHVMHRHDGKLRIASQIGVGSTFTCDFPLDRQLKKRNLNQATNH
jgi:two-component system phosphate regulon sensor histidine kinase PhoR